MSSPPPWPNELRLAKDHRVLTVRFDSGEHFDLGAEFLRVHSPSAEVKGHGSVGLPPVTGKAGVTIVALEPVGRYAVRIRFNDGHDTGLFSWALLYRLGHDRDTLWQAYLDRVAAQR